METNSKSNVIIIGIGGGTCSGKTSIAKKLYRLLINKNIKAEIISQDNFYKTLDSTINPLNYNFDDPSAFDLNLIMSTLNDIKKRKTVYIPEYDYKNHKQTIGITKISDVDIIIFEGILALYFKSILDLMDLKIFVDTPSDLRLIRRIVRDTKIRGRTIDSVIKQYKNTVRDSHDNYVEPSKDNAGMIIPMGKDNHDGINIALSYIEKLYFSTFK